APPPAPRRRDPRDALRPCDGHSVRNAAAPQPLLALFALPVAELLTAADHEAQRLAEAGDLAGVRVFANLGRFLGTDGQVLELGASGIDDLVRGLRPAGRAGDDVARADRKALGADPHLARAVE